MKCPLARLIGIFQNANNSSNFTLSGTGFACPELVEGARRLLVLSLSKGHGFCCKYKLATDYTAKTTN